MRQQFFLGDSSISELLPVLRRYAPERIFLVRGKKSYVTCGAAAVMNEVCGILRCSVTEFYDFEENPKLEDVRKGLSLLVSSNSSLIVGIGGGSVLDMSKLLRFFYSYSGEATGCKFLKEKELLPLIALPTTAGTGSEATHFSVLYKDKIKYSVEHTDILPDVAIVYPPFTYNNPKYLTACTGFDALAQGIESYWNVNATEESDEYAKRAIQLLCPNLPVAVNAPTKQARDKVSEGSYWAGRAINITKTTAPHAFSYPFTTYYGYPHGHAVALTFPFFMQYNCMVRNSKLQCSLNVDAYNEKIKILCDLLSFSFMTTYGDMVKYIMKLGLSLKKVGEPFNLELILSSINMDRLSNNPRIFSPEDVVSLIHSINSNES